MRRHPFIEELDDDLLAKLFRRFTGSATVVADPGYPGSFKITSNLGLVLDPNYPVSYTLHLGSQALIPDPRFSGSFTIGYE